MELISVIVLPLTICAFFSLGTFVSSFITGVEIAWDANQTQLSVEEITLVEVINLSSIKHSERPLKRKSQKSDLLVELALSYLFMSYRPWAR